MQKQQDDSEAPQQSEVDKAHGAYEAARMDAEFRTKQHVLALEALHQ